MERTCRVCNEEKPIEKFSTMGKNKQHIRKRTCMRCIYERYKNYYTKYRRENYKKREPRFKLNNATEEQQMEQLKKIFNKKVIKQDGCWGWNNVLHKSGYTVIQYNGEQTGGHRASWLIHKGKVPKNLCVLHKCDVRKCTNPDHLFLGTYKDNTQDMLAKNRRILTKKNSGETCSWSKLNNRKVKEIRKLLKLGVTVTRVALDFEVSQGAIEGIKHNKTWKHVK